MSHDGVMYAYLASPIDLSHDPLAGGWDAPHAEATSGVVWYSPLAAWSVGPGCNPNSGLQMANLGVLNLCGLLVAVLPDDTPTLGVPLEVAHARQAGIPVAVVAGPQTSARSWAVAWLSAQERVRVFGWDSTAAEVIGWARSC